MRRVKFFHADTRRLRYLTEEEFGRLLNEAGKIAKSPFLREAIELAAHTGLRRGNLLGLQWAWIDWLNRVVRVPVTKTGKPHAVPLNAKAYAALQRLWNSRGESTHVFEHTKGPSTGEALQDLKKGLHTALENAGIEDFRWHDLRHTFASWLVMRGASMRAVSELLGQQSIQMTLRTCRPGSFKDEVRLARRHRPERRGQQERKIVASPEKRIRNSQIV
jgi:integrase